MKSFLNGDKAHFLKSKEEDNVMDHKGGRLMVVYCSVRPILSL